MYESEGVEEVKEEEEEEEEVEEEEVSDKVIQDDIEYLYLFLFLSYIFQCTSFFHVMKFFISANT